MTDEYFQRVTRALIVRLRQHEETVLQEGKSVLLSHEDKSVLLSHEDIQ